MFYLSRMVHSCIVPGCTNLSNKEECKNIKFYTLPFKDELLLQTWLALICKRREEVTVHSRICSTHFTNGIKKSYYDFPQIFPWQKYTHTAAIHQSSPAIRQLSPAEIIYHDHCYCLPHYKSISVVSTGSSYLTPITASDILHLTLPSIDASTTTDPLIQSQTPFSVELFINSDDAINFYTGF